MIDRRPDTSPGPRDEMTALRQRIASLEERCADLEQSEEMLRITLSNISDPVFITDRDGAFTFVCPNVEIALGYTAAEVSAMKRVDRLLGPSRFDFERLDRAGELHNIEHVVADRGGRDHDLLVNVKRIAIGRGAVLYTCRDVTDRKAAAERIRRLREQLTHVSRVATLGEFTAGIAHEVNQPLSTIANLAGGLRRKLGSSGRGADTELADAAEMIRSEAVRAAEIIRRLRQMIRRQESRRSNVNLAQVVTELRSLLEHEASQTGVEVRLRFGRDLPFVSANAAQIQQVILNLVRNSCDIMRESRTTNPTISVRVFQNDAGSVQCDVVDNGPGVDPADLDRIFDAFYTTRADGLGMGLAISRSIIEEHGGQLWANRDGAHAIGESAIGESAIGEDGGAQDRTRRTGAVLSFVLPICDETCS